jgi:2'-5' RNA ligase
MARVRTFVGVAVGDETRSRAAALQRELAKAGAGVNWVPAENFHVTLVFLGDVEDRDLHAVCRAVAAAAAGEPPFTLGVSGVGAFPHARRPKTLWAGVTDGAAEMVRLHGLLEPPLLELGVYRPEERPYTPHLTLGRVKTEADGPRLAPALPRHAGWAGGASAVDEVIVYASDMRREGPVYTPLGRGQLLGRPAG